MSVFLRQRASAMAMLVACAAAWGPPPPPGTTVTTIVSDDFNSSSLDTSIWTFIDPRDDGSISLDGGGTGDAHLRLSVPAGQNHDPWINGNFAPRIMQSAPDTDFEIEARFVSIPTQQIQMQGLIVEQDLDHFLRFEVFHVSGRLRLYAAALLGGTATEHVDRSIVLTPPFHLRVRREGNLWTFSYSDDGQTWSAGDTFLEPLVVSSVGLTVGNFGAGGSAPAHTAEVDYFFVTSAPILGEDAGPVLERPPLIYTVIADPTSRAAEIRWHTDAPSVGSVHYGLTMEYLGGTVTDLEYTIDHSIRLPGLLPDTTYHFQVTSVATNRRAAATEDMTFVTDPLTVNQPPVADAGPDQVVEDSDLSGSELVTLDGSASFDPDGFIIDYEWSEGQTVIANGVNPTVDLIVGSHLITLTVTDDEQATHTDDVLITVREPPVPSTITSDDFNESVLDPSLWTFIDPLGDTLLELTGAGTGDAHLRLSVLGGITHQPWRFGNTAPRIMQAANDTDFELEVKFESDLTQEFQMQGVLVEQDANNYLRFDFYSANDGIHIFAASFFEGVPVVQSNRIITGGVPLFMRIGREAHQWTQAYSADGQTWQNAASFSDPLVVTSVGVFAGNAGGASGTTPAHTAIVDYVFNTAAPIVPEDPVFPGPPVISNVQVAVGSFDATVTWTTNEPATTTVAYGLTPSYEIGTVGNLELVLSHTATLLNLLPNTTYHFEARSVDAEQLSATSGDLTFTTLSSALNPPPAAAAGPDQIVQDLDRNGVEIIVLDGSGSYGEIISYDWHEGSTLIATGVGPSVTLPLGVHTITLTVTNVAQQTSTDTVLITITAPDAVRTNDGLVVGYDFQEGGGDIVFDVSGVGAPMDLTINDPAAVTRVPRGLLVDTPMIMTTAGPGTKING